MSKSQCSCSQFSFTLHKLCISCENGKCMHNVNFNLLAKVQVQIDKKLDQTHCSSCFKTQGQIYQSE